MTIQDFIKQRPYLVWYVKEPGKLNDESIVEHTLNYGNWNDVRQLFKIIGVKRASAIFNRQINQKRINYDTKIMNYFKLYFSRYAQRSFNR